MMDKHDEHFPVPGAILIPSMSEWKPDLGGAKETTV